jgi:hypothetical protein
MTYASDFKVLTSAERTLNSIAIINTMAMQYRSLVAQVGTMSPATAKSSDGNIIACMPFQYFDIPSHSAAKFFLVYTLHLATSRYTSAIL